MRNWNEWLIISLHPLFNASSLPFFSLLIPYWPSWTRFAQATRKISFLILSFSSNPFWPLFYEIFQMIINALSYSFMKISIFEMRNYVIICVVVRDVPCLASHIRKAKSSGNILVDAPALDVCRQPIWLADLHPKASRSF